MRTYISGIEYRIPGLGNTLPLIFIILLLFPLHVFSAEPIATPYFMDFYGKADGAKAGDEITVYSSRGILCGRFVVTKDGQYGFLHVYGDDPKTEVIEGAKVNEPLMFRLNGEPLQTDGLVLWTGDAERNRVDIKK
ncbi:MAG: hypothetical protein N2745_11615 [Syntrophorhabdaceae bacterium]|nr:hypothetical protein [Syntrophorhabdaceae bacterium]